MTEPQKPAVSKILDHPIFLS